MRNRIIAATPLLATIAFLSIGFTTGIWHPTWVVFFSILIVPDILHRDFYLKLYPIAVIAAYPIPKAITATNIPINNFPSLFFLFIFYHSFLFNY